MRRRKFISALAVSAVGCRTRKSGVLTAKQSEVRVPFSKIPMISTDQDDLVKGSLEEFKKDIPAFLIRHGSNGEPVKRFRIGNTLFVIVSDPDFVKEVYKMETKSADVPGKKIEGDFQKGMFHDKFYTATGVSSVLPNKASNEVWANYRKPIVKAGHQAAVKEMKEKIAKQVVEHLDVLAAEVKSKGTLPLNVTEWMDRVSLILVLKNLFGLEASNYSKEQMDKILAVWDTISHEVMEIGVNAVIHVFAVLNKVLTNPFSSVLEEQAKVMNISQKYIDASKSLRKEVEILVNKKLSLMKENASEVDSQSDMLAMLLAARSSDGRTPEQTLRQVVDEAITIILAGHETTSGTALWTLHILSQGMKSDSSKRSFEIQEALAKEALEPSAAGSDHRKTVTKVFDETLRIYPTIYINERESRTNTEVKVSNDNGDFVYEIPAGVNVILSPLVVHRSARNWERPDSFNIERDHEKGKKEFRFLPFGSGVHMCPGRHFGQTVYESMIGGFHARFQYEAVDENKAIFPKGGISLRPSQPLKLNLKPR